MNQRERFLKIARFELKGEIMLPVTFQWFWATAMERWKKEGFPSDVHTAQFFGFERMETVPVNLGLLPPFDFEVLEEDEEKRIVIDRDGVKRKEFKPKSGAEEQTARSMSQWIGFPVKDRKSWGELRKRLNPRSPARYPLYWDDLKRQWKNRDYALGIWGGTGSVSFYGVLRDWIGMENFSVMFYEQPSLVHEMMEYLEHFYIEVLRRALEEVEIDFLGVWEDMAYKTASLLSPKQFREFMLPHYKKVTDFIRGKGVDLIFVDSDGNIDELIPLFLEGGVNGVLPLEVAAGMDAVSLRKKYGSSLYMVGNIDKRVLASGNKKIGEEVNKKVPHLLSGGGYFPGVDHAVPPDVSFSNYMYYLETLRKVAA